jgi:hypothetical protein
MALLYIGYERLVTGIHNEDTMSIARTDGASGGCVGTLVRSTCDDAAGNARRSGGWLGSHGRGDRRALARA